jgi:hypothetical protein
VGRHPPEFPEGDILIVAADGAVEEVVLAGDAPGERKVAVLKWVIHMFSIMIV